MAVKTWRDLGRAAVLSGGILLAIGLYFILIRAGIPYQDPTPEMQISYAAWMRAGETNALWGIALLAAGLVIRLFCRVRGGRTAGREDKQDP